MPRLKRKAKRTIVSIFILLAILIGFFSYKYIINKDNENPSIKDFIDSAKDNEKEKIQTFTAKLIATGDGLAHPAVYNSGYNKETNSYDFSDMLAFTKEKLKGYDIKYYNQETIFDDSKSYSGYPTFNTPSGFGTSMLAAGFNLVSLATNHSMDRGSESAKASAKWWEEQKNILATGMASTPEKRNEHKIMNANGITYTMLSYTYGTNGIPVTEDYTVNLFNEEQVKADIAAVRDKVDVLIVAMHWGIEYQQNATEIQKQQAKFLADNGVDIVLGTHSHCIEPWEWIDDTVVFYSFGNFVSNQMDLTNPMQKKIAVIGMFATLDITKTVDTEQNTTTIKIDNIGADLNYSYKFYNKDKGKYDFLVIPFSKMEAQYLNNYESIYNEFSAVLKKYDSNINIEPLPIS